MDYIKRLIFTAVLLTAIFTEQGNCQEEPGYCRAFTTINEVTKEEKQVETVTSILDTISPEISEVLQLNLNSNSTSESDEPPSQVAYETLAENLGVKPTPIGYNTFVEAVNEVSLAQAEACSNSSFVPTPDLVSQLAEEFETTFLAEDRDLANVRLVYGKLLCLNTRSEQRKKRQAKPCTCSFAETIDEEELSKAKSICEFFKCLALKFEIEKLAEIFGVEVSGSSEQIPSCLAFALDFSGSMVEELDAARQIIRGFLVNDATFNQQLCYILVAFSRFPEPRPDVEEPVIVYILKEDEESLEQLNVFSNYIRDLELEGGGGGPEHSLDGMLAALRVTNKDGRELMIKGSRSQLIVLTDEPAENTHLTETVIQEATERGVCIHFFLRERALQEESFRIIAERTTGTTIQEFTAVSLSAFVTKYRESPCMPNNPSKRSIKLSSVVKRSSSLDDRCKVIYISSFTYLLTLSIQADTGSTVSITRPNGTITQIVIAINLGTLVEANPMEGQWRVCTSSGNLEIIPDQKIVFDTSILFVNEGSENPSSIPPPLCTSSRIALLSSQASKMSFASLNLINLDGVLARRINLKKCEEFFVSDVITFPRGASGTYNVQLAGHDTNGVAFMQDTSHRVVLDDSRSVNYELTVVGSSSIEIGTNDTTSFSFQLHNPGDYSTSFRFASSRVIGFKKEVTPIAALIPPGDRAEITFTVQVDPQQAERLSPGSSHRFTLYGSNGCRSVSASKIVVFSGDP